MILSFVLSWKLGLLMLAFVPVSFFAGRLSKRKKVKGKRIIEQGERVFNETVENIKVVSSLCVQKHFVSKFEEIFEKKYNKNLKYLHIQAFFYSLSNILMFLNQMAAFAFGFYLFEKEKLSVANLYRVYGAMAYSSLILSKVYAQVPDQHKAKEAARKCFKIMYRKSKIDSLSQDGQKPNNIHGNIEFKNVFFDCPFSSGLKILNGFNLSIKQGQTNALFGTSGCGKKTTCCLLLRFYDVTNGSITLDGVDIRELNVQWLRSRIGVIFQEPVILNTSIKENITCGDILRNEV